MNIQTRVVHLRFLEKTPDADYVTSRLIDCGIPVLVEDLRLLTNVAESLSSLTGPTRSLEDYEIVFYVTLDRGFDRDVFDAVLLDAFAAEVCSDLLESGEFDIVCHESVRKRDATNCCAYAAKSHSGTGRVFLKPVQRQRPQKLIDLNDRISRYDPSLNTTVTNGIDPSDAAFSVVVPVYNRENYVLEALRSVAASRCDAKHELVIVNDASTDSTERLCVDFIKDLKIPAKVITKHINCQLAHARNTGVDASVGDYIFFLDSDNLVLEDCLRSHYEEIVGSGASVCYAPIRKFRESHGMRHMLNDISNRPFDFDRMVSGNYIDAMAMVRRSDLIEVGKFSTWHLHFGTGGYEDYDLWLRMHSAGKKFHFIGGGNLSLYRLHESNMLRECAEDGAIPYRIIMNNYRREE